MGPCGVALLLMACGANRTATPRQYNQATLDSASNSCRQAPSLCRPSVGEKLQVVPPPPAQPPPPISAAVSMAIAGGALIQPSRHLDDELRRHIEKSLSECADEARSQAMLQHFKTRGPTQQECEEEIGKDSQGRTITRAMQLGLEQHKIAMDCTARILDKLSPGGFSIQPRYRYDPQTRTTEYLPDEVVKKLLKQGRGTELRGTLEPDIVIHEADARRVQAVYDYKFPCVSTDKRSRWREYPDGHPYEGRHQGSMYKQALGVDPAMVQPRIGVFR
ncbi:conserved uncharacterized protein [Stigmatella aurantiaca DW4/3-1]|uniref:Conserved uncharacterized protein n=3 Tax=Stigmatella aurantiaca TaxID=41 RepID=E3FIV6_STIAD|nr:conserved uncharacterized protein [Stigmatella aurantiaca DW4/3-1]